MPFGSTQYHSTRHPARLPTSGTATVLLYRTAVPVSYCTGIIPGTRVIWFPDVYTWYLPQHHNTYNGVYQIRTGTRYTTCCLVNNARATSKAECRVCLGSRKKLCAPILYGRSCPQCVTWYMPGTGYCTAVPHRIPSRPNQPVHRISFEMSYFGIIIICDVGGGALLAWYENRGTGRCFSFPSMIPVTKSSPPPATGRGSDTRSLEQPRPPMVVSLTYSCDLRVATSQS